MRKKRKVKGVSINVTVEECDSLAEICEHATAFCADQGLEKGRKNAITWRKNFLLISAGARAIEKTRKDDTKERRTDGP